MVLHVHEESYLSGRARSHQRELSFEERVTLGGERTGAKRWKFCVGVDGRWRGALKKIRGALRCWQMVLHEESRVTLGGERIGAKRWKFCVGVDGRWREALKN